MARRIKAPWYKYYGNIKKHLDYPDISVYKLIEKTAIKNPDSISYNYYGTKRTYKDFMKEIDICAKSFKSLGVKKGDRVSICMPNTPEAIIAFYAINKIGAISNMIHPLSSENEIKYFINVSKSSFIVAINVSLNKIIHIEKETNLKNIILVSPSDSMPIHMKIGYNLTQGRKLKLEYSDKIIKWKDFISLAKNYDRKVPICGKGEDTAAILYSGGTTGYPKGIELTNLNFNAMAMQSEEAVHTLKEQDKLLAIMPIFHGFGLGICIHTVQFHGGTSILLPTFSPKTFATLIKKYKPNIIAGVPTLYEALLKTKGLENFDLSFLTLVISGGDSLSIELKKKIDKFLKEHNATVQVREGYGLTECVTGSCLTPPEYYREGSIGIPFPDTFYKIVKPDTIEEVEYGEEGEICLTGPTVMKGYLGDEVDTKITIRKHKDGNKWLHTGDIGYMDKDGFVYFKQRLKRMIVSSGYCIYPQYIENVIDSHPDVLMSCVIGIPHEYKKEVAKAFIVLRPDVKLTEEVKKSIKELVENKIAKYSWPYEYEYRSELPKTLVGKVAFNELIKEEKEKREKNKKENENE